MQVLRSNLVRERCYLMVPAALVLSMAVTAAQAQPSFSYSASGVDSNGRIPGHAGGGDVCNGIMGPYVYGGPAFPVGNIRLVGTASSYDPMWWATQVDELAFSVIIRDSGGIKKAQWNNYNIKPIHAQFWYHNPVGVNVTRNASSLGTILPGDQIQIRFWEAFDDYGGGNPCAAVDAVWSNVGVTFYPAPPTGGGGGGGDFEVVLNTSEVLTINSEGSEFDPVLVIYNDAAELLAFDEGNGDPADPSVIMLDSVTPGLYFLAVAGEGAGFADGYMVSPGDGGGNLQLNHNDGSVEDRTHPDSVFWYRVKIVAETVDCPADLTGDGNINLSDLAALLAVYGTTCN